MIEELTSNQVVDQYGNVHGQAPCSQWEMMEKINEIIRYLNEKEEQK